MTRHEQDGFFLIAGEAKHEWHKNIQLMTEASHVWYLKLVLKYHAYCDCDCHNRKTDIHITTLYAQSTSLREWVCNGCAEPKVQGQSYSAGRQASEKAKVELSAREEVCPRTPLHFSAAGWWILWIL